MSVEAACWCKHACCQIDTDPELKILFGDKIPYHLWYICDECDCHNPTPDWWDPWEK